MSDAPNVVALPLCGLANDNRQLAVVLRNLADEIESGTWGDVEHIIAVIDVPEINHVTFGRPCDRATTVGLLTYATHRIITPKQ